jgi:flagellar FliL protein
MSEEKKESAASAPESASGGGNNKLTMILTIVNTVVSVAVIGLLFTSLQKEKKTQRIEDIVVEEGAHAEGGGGGHGAPPAGGGHGAPAPAGGHGAPAGGHGGADAHGAKKLAGFGKMVTLEQFTVNLTTPGSTTPKYVRVNISLEVPGDDVETELNQRMPQVRNAIIDLFNSKRPSDVVSEEGRQYLKEEIRSALNGFMVSGKVKGVFFTNFALSG